MNDIAMKMRESVKAAMDEEVIDTPPEDNPPEPEYSATEKEALEIGWNPEGTDKDGNTLSAEEFLARKPLFNKIKNQSEQLAEIQRALKEVKEDALRQAKASMQEKEQLLQELKEARESALDNLETDEVRKLDKQIDSVREEIADSKTEVKETKEIVSPYYADFESKNEWAKDKDSALYAAGLGMAQRWIAKNGQPKDGNDKPMYDYIHEEIRKQFPEKFKTPEKPGTKVASSKTRTSSYSKDKSITLADVPDDGTREIIKNMARQSGKTVEEYLKNYTIDDFKR